MAKKYETSTDFDFDKDFALDDDFNFDDMSGGGSKSGGSRSANLAGRAMKGVGEGLTENLIESTIRRALPKGYGEALDVFQEGKNSLASLYNSALRELKPGLDSAKRLTRQLMPKIDSSMPDAMAEMINEWSKPDESQGAGDAVSPEKQREDLMGIEIGAIFQGQAEFHKRTEERADARQRIGEGLTQVRHKDEMRVLSVIAQSVHRQVQYQDKILANFQRKSLELQMRQYYATVDQLNVMRKGFMVQNDFLRRIEEASRMPDFEKTTISGKFREMTRNKFIEQGRDALFGASSDFFKQFTENISKSITEQLQAFSMGLMMSADTASMAFDTADSMGADFDFTAEAAGMAGQAIGGKILGGLQDRLGAHTAKDPRISKLGKQAGFAARNQAWSVNQVLTKTGRTNDFGEKDWGPVDFLRRFLLSQMPGTMPDMMTSSDKLSDMHQPAPINRLTLKSWNEVIPGYLARIHREIYTLRTGDEKAPLLAYDFSSNKFTTERGVRSGIFKTFLQGGRKDVQSNISELMNTVGLNKLKDGDREKVKRSLLGHALKRGDASFETLTKSSTWHELPPELRAKVTTAFKSHYGTDAKGEFSSTDDSWTRVTDVDDQFKKLTKTLSDPRAHIQALINAGQGEALQRYGVVLEDGRINMELFKDYLLGKDLVDDDGEFKSRNLRELVINRGAPPTPEREPVATVSASAQQSTPGAAAPDFSGLTGEFKDISDVLKGHGNQYDKMISLLADLNKQFAAGLPTANITMEELEERSRKSKLNPLNWTVGDAVGGALRAGRSLGKSLWASAKRVSGMVNTAGMMGLKAAKSVFYNTADILNDIWVKGEIKARLTKVKLEAGEYFDESTGKVLKTWKDIKGRVVDKDGNLIIDVDELKNAWVGRKYGRALKDVVRIGAGLIGNVYGTARNIGDLGVKGILGAKSKAIDLWKKYRPPYDVYVKGDDEPTLYKNGFVRGLYFDKETSAKLRHPAEIKGQVVDDEGNLLITKEMLERGLVDVNGVTTGGPLARGMGMNKMLAGKGLKMAYKTFERVRGAIGDVLRGVGGLFYDFFGGIFGIRGEFLDNAKIQTETQLAILDLLEERLPGKRVAGDADGDGIRDGSLEDLRRKRKAKQDEAAGKKDATAGDKAGGGGMIAGIAGALKKLFGKVKGEEDEDDGIGLDDVADGVSVASDVKDMKGGKRSDRIRRGAGKAGKAGRFGKWSGRAASLGKGALRWGAKGLGLAGALYGGFSAYDHLKKGEYGDAALDAGLAAGGIAMTGMGGAALTGLGALATGALALISAPVALTALGLTAAYFGYRYLTKACLGVMSRPRMAQYGFQDSDEEVGIYLENIVKLETMLEPAVTVDKDGKAYLDKGKFKMQEVLELFGVSPNNFMRYRSFMTWFDRRFKPVFMAHVSAVKAKFKDVTLQGLDSAKDKNLLIAHLDATSMPGSDVYNITASPFKEIEYLKVTSGGVATAIELAKAELAKQVKDQKNNPVSAKSAATAGAAAAVALAPGQRLKPGDAGYKPGKPADDPTGMATTGAASASYIRTDIRQLSALDAVKYRAYGLVAMDAEKILALKKLEGWLEPRVSWAGKNPSLSVDMSDLATAAAPWFGFPGLNSKQGLIWMKWFEQRFRPVFLNYIGGLAAYTGKQTIESATKALYPKDAVSIANALRGTMSSTVMRRSVWEVTESPWRDYVLNNDPASTDGNIKALVETSKAVLNDEHRKVASDTARKAEAERMKMAPKPTGSLAKDALNAAIFAGYDPKKVVIDSSGRGVQGAGDPVSVGGGTGGKYDSLPTSSGDGWAANKDLIIAASKMVGMDPKTMASLIAIESGFQTGVKAGTSSATGLGQFIDDTWKMMLKKYGAQYGIPLNTPPTDARANALMSALYAKDNMAYLKGSLNRPVTATDLYMAHFLGPEGARQFLKAPDDAIAAQLLPKAAAANKSIFYADSMSRPRTTGEIYQLLMKRMMSKAAKFGVSGVDFGGSATDSIMPASTAKSPQDTKTVAGQSAAYGGGNVPGTSVPSGMSKSDAPVIPARKVPVISASVAPQPQSSSDAGPSVADVLQRRAPMPELSRTPEASPAVVARGQAQADQISTANSAAVNKLLQAQLDEQKKMNDNLNKLINIMDMKRAEAPAQASPTSGSSAGAFAEKPTRAMPKPPVSLSR